ncbi:MAG: endolytic transglycosylase MltG [Clostridia bacterium]|nr:endolytic transglycosylase MltG [Clostridia bacterium]
MEENKRSVENGLEENIEIKADEQNAAPIKEDFDEFKISDGFVIYEEPEKPAPVNKKKKKEKGPVIWIISIILVAFMIAFGIIFAGADYLGIGFGRGSGECEITVSSGATTAQIVNQIKETGAIKSTILFRLYVKLKHYDGKFRDGYHHFDKEAGYEAIAQELMQNGASAKRVWVTIVEGQNVDDIAEVLEKKGVCSKEDFFHEVQEGSFDYDFVNQIPVKSVHYRLEGYLFPETYQFYCYDSKECAHLAVDKMLSTLNDKLKKEKIDINNITVYGKNYSFHEIMTMASIVEMEAGSHKDEMPKVSAVFFNRLRSTAFTTLGSSPTRKYPYGEGRYNTYEYQGIPVGPLCSPGIDSVKAACSPQQGFDDYYYFVTDAKMKFYYRKTLAEHNAIIAKLKAEKNWIYEEW